MQKALEAGLGATLASPLLLAGFPPKDPEFNRS
jgi:hypothetical protein